MFLFNKRSLASQVIGLSVFKTVVDNSPNAVIILNIDGVILYANNTALKLIELPLSHIINKKQNFIRFVDGKTGKDLNDLIEKLVKSGKSVRDFNKNSIILKSNGKTVSVAISVTPFKDKDDKIIGSFIIFRDTTQDKEIEQTKTEFVSLASHQLRTPLSTINWYSEMMLTGDTGKLTKEQNRYVEEIYHGTQRMIELVNDLLNISRIDLGTITIKPEVVNFKEVIESVLSELFPLIKNKKIRIEEKYDKSIPNIILDSKLARIIGQNLLSNAVKYTPKNGQVFISINKLKNKLLIKIADTGIGIPKDQQAQIFSRLFRAKNAKEKLTEGTGLGLYIVQLAVEKLNGQVWFESIENGGTTFYVSIPLKGIKKRGGVKLKE
ncbi:MAG: hypothetical protein A3B89_01395 [Candidatus Buchananbacteria bacterium RIFCSPHIGHO2_02_FULL_40_13]|uniref:histidine kinase n=1 Tax=Candidatus Buchananbacteria bacterium RIFCSPLOWO2_01_FULL_39_33 TaxID=1797543 RepID=A0A1G1YL95_9BACT|nr:MAG: hypothetical protein A2820_03550 [Candidatus Buchananbacteria bacterium RIFCSPHIGHO2_01_FULL_40_35]OGY50142.1 MAG: hypothetical protein A3B89_01395 [Candidatus Buchananbacteria bacterium RIFCSPHIGHO2_02_FULL_40_13]OGY53125.1 MAG: hypothetical protein A3A02_00210 [Candidatus Buchananbacteria bacterium RIFCSPLOWO2_01_FULL_39_33]